MKTFLLFAMALLTVSHTAEASPDKTKRKRPNIVLLVCESTDGRTWREGYQNNVIPLPNLRSLEEGGYAFHCHYSNTPVCCPSRATLWSGRHAHKIPHIQRQSHTNRTTGETKIKQLAVDGVWNNFEGLPHDFDERIDQVLQRKAGYATRMSGKLDFTTGGHSENVKLSAWTMYTRFPYNLHTTKGWADEPPNICADNGTVLPGSQRSAHQDDWNTLHDTVNWMKQQNTSTDNPFFVYQGMNIVHPSYRTNEYYYNQINPNKIQIPEWPPLEDLHPCDFQSSMLKGCVPPLDNATAREYFYSRYRRRNIRRIYYAMIAEFDAMVGAYMQAIRDIGEWDNTIFIVTSDHGDLQMEHQQSYKMSPYDASVSVPLIIHDGRVSKDIGEKTRRKRVIDKPTQLINLYPTIMDLAGVSHTDYPPFDMLDGHSLVPLMTDNYSNSDETPPDFVVSQFHGDNIAMSWFLIVRRMPCIPNNNAAHDIEERQLSNTRTKMCTMKLVVYGTGVEIEHQLFDVTHDPDEMTNLASNQTYLPMMISLEQTLRSVVDYPRVALNVARYNQQSMKHWMEVTGDPEWRTAIHSKGLRWDDAFDYDVEGSFKALEEWVNGRAKILPCRSDLVWPPPSLIEVQE
jgi:arylsulfatase K